MAIRSKKALKDAIKALEDKPTNKKEVKPAKIKTQDGADFYAHKHIINYLTETDLYKFTQQQFYVRKVHNYKSIDDMTVDEILAILPDFKNVLLDDVYHPIKYI